MTITKKQTKKNRKILKKLTLTFKYPNPSIIPHWKQSSVLVITDCTISGVAPNAGWKQTKTKAKIGQNFVAIIFNFSILNFESKKKILSGQVAADEIIKIFLSFLIRACPLLISQFSLSCLKALKALKVRFINNFEELRLICQSSNGGLVMINDMLKVLLLLIN